MQIDFVKIPYSTAPFMVRNTERAFSKNVDSALLEKKRREVKLYGTDLYGQYNGHSTTIRHCANLCGHDTDNILDLAMKLEEDIAIMHKGVLIAICFCFPSGFVPSERVGLNLDQVHAPVADGDLLRRASPRIARVMCEQESFKRNVWTVTVNPDLSNHPKNVKNITPKTLDDLYFRTEYQTTLKVDQNTSLFFVKVNVVPLKDVYSQKILESINSMSQAVLEYKNLTLIKNLLNSINDK